ncbi:MAG: MFS transporter [Roseiflexaceae bacterium]
MRLFQRDVYYGWVIVLALACTETISWGVLFYTFAVLMPSMEAELGWSRVAMTGAFSLALLLAGLAAPLFGHWLDRRGARMLMTLGSCLATILVFAWALVTDLFSFYLIWAGLGLAMAAVLYEPSFVVVTAWFDRQRVRAMSIVTFAAGFASVIFIPLASYLARTQGWRTALVLLGVILGLGTIPLHAALLRRRPQDLGLLPDGDAMLAPNDRKRAAPTRSLDLRAALRDSAFWWLTSAFTLSALAAVAITIHIIPYMLDHGYSAGFAAGTASLIGAMKFPGRLLFTPLEARMARRWIAVLLALLQTLALLLLVIVPTAAGALAFAALFGAANGAITLARPALLAEYYGPAQYGSISGVLALFLAGAQALAPIGAGLLYAGFGSYEPVIWVGVTISLISVATVSQARVQSWPKYAVE